MCRMWESICWDTAEKGPLDVTLSIVDVGTTPNVLILTLRERVQRRSHAHHGSANIVR